jgi:hypothetical protein
MVLNNDETPIHLRKATVSRGIAKYRDLDPRNEYKVEFDFDLQRNEAIVELKSQFNQIVLREKLDCQN